MSGTKQKSGRKPLPPEKRKKQVCFYCTPEQEKKLRKAAEKILGQ